MSDLGRVVRKGRIRVDARKAITKLREHLLVDLHLYAVELVRAAALAGAARVDVEHDADDVVITFDGTPLDPPALPRLFEHLVSEPDGDEARHLRLIALAANAALGLDPAWIAITAASSGRAARVTWTPALVAAIERDEAPLPEVEEIPLPPRMPERGIRFHFHRKLGWDVVRRAAASALPREVALLVEASCSARIPFFVNGARPPAPARLRAIASAPITLPGARRAVVEIVDTTALAPHVELCELGLLLSRAGFSFGAHFPMSEHLGVSPPIRIVVDSDALPTNASRSAVREDAMIFGSLRTAAAPALSDLIAGLAAAAFGHGRIPEGVTIDMSAPNALREALGAFLCTAEASLIARVAVPDALRLVLALPHFADGLGRPLRHADIPRADPLLVWTGDKPVPEEMSPWAHRILWRRGRVAERILASRAALPPEELADLAKRGTARRQKLLATPPGEAMVPDGDYLARERFAFPSGPGAPPSPFAGLTAEIAIARDPSSYVRNLALRVFLEGRCFEAFPMPDDTVPLPCVIALDWPDHVVPKIAYEGVEPTAGLRAALAFAVRAAVLLCERDAADRLRSGVTFDVPRAAVLRAALATAMLAPTKMYSAQGFEMPALAGLEALVRAPVWPTTERAFVSLEALCAYAAKTGTICVAAPGTPGRAIDGRPVVCLGSAELAWLSMCLRSDIPLLRYDAALIPASAPPRARSRGAMDTFIQSVAAASLAPIHRAEERGFAFAVTLGASETRVWHGGVEILRTALHDSLGGVTIAIDDDSIVATPDWKGVKHSADPALAARAERAFAERLVGALSGDAKARGELTRSLAGRAEDRFVVPDSLAALPPSVHRFLVDRAERGRRADATEDERALAARIELLPFLTILGHGGEPVVTNLADVAARWPAPNRIPYLRAAPRFRPVDWHPLILPEPQLTEALARWSHGRLLDGGSDLLSQERRAARMDALDVFLQQPPADPKAVGPKGDATGLTVHLAPIPAHRLVGVTVALPARGADVTSHALAEILLEHRPLFDVVLDRVAIPVVARVALLDVEALETATVLTPAGSALVAERVTTAAQALAFAILERARQPGQSRAALFGDLRALRLVFALVAGPSPDSRLEKALRHPELRWPTVQGDERPFSDLALLDGALWTGTEVFAAWLPPPGAPTDLDRPILHIPDTQEGTYLANILQRIGVKLRSVTAEASALQHKRAQGAGDRPTLAIRPAHPRLAEDLHRLQLAGVEGEIAVYDSGESLAEVTDLGGDTVRIRLDLGFPARAVARVEILSAAIRQELAEKIARAAVRLLVSLVPAIDELPGFVRGHLRTLTCKAVAKDRDPPAQVKRAPLFPDIDGRFHSFEEMLSGALGDLSCTFDLPPYPKARQEGCTLLLTPVEHLQLTTTRARSSEGQPDSPPRKPSILNVTEWMRRELAAEQRREAPPVATIAIETSLRPSLLASAPIDDDGLRGEVGLLGCSSAEARGIAAFTTRRPVCRIDDSPGWPVAAAVDGDSLRVNRWFDALVPDDEVRVRRAVRAAADALVKSLASRALPPEAERLATLILDEAVPPVSAYGSSEPVMISGVLHLPAVWPSSPTVRIRAQGVPEIRPAPVLLAGGPIRPILPVCGEIFVSHGAEEVSRGMAARVAFHLRGVVERMLSPLLKAGPGRLPTGELLAYHWNLRLLGATSLGEPAAAAADGRALGADDVIAVLHRGADLWLSDRSGTIDGAVPEGTPPFVLLDDDSPLLRVLRARVPAERFKHLGAPAPSKPSEALAPPSVPPPGPDLETATFDAAATRKTSRSWLSSVIGRVSDLLSGPAVESAPTGIGAAVERTLRALRLREEPVIGVEEVRRGRLVRYDEDRRVVLINVAHPALARHVASPTPSAVRRACIALVAAALSEVNIALEHITDHDESLALLELLRQESTADKQGP